MKNNLSHVNPYYDLWRYSCSELEWAGPWANTASTKFSHHILPIFYHHFGCVCPSFAALHAIAAVAQPTTDANAKESKPIYDIGCGNGYWTYMLRNLPLDPGMKPLKVIPVDNYQSIYRTTWVGDTINMDGPAFLKDSAEASVLLLVYPPVSGSFTEDTLKAFRGDTIVVAGTQTLNGYTGFSDVLVDQWIEENLKAFGLVLRIPLPSFAGKDDALFVFKRKNVWDARISSM
jgi:hypothetical protein